MRILFGASLAFLATLSSASAGILSFSGKVYGEGGGGPIANALVIPGVFAPGFNALDYTRFYGDDAANLLPDAYGMAVADGNFDPAGNGALTNADGSFNWLGNPSVPPGRQLWFFVFQDGTTNSFFQVLATSSASHWQSPAVTGSTTILANEADVFVMGQRHLDGVAPTVVPFPEPAATLLALTSLAGMALLRRALS